MSLELALLTIASLLAGLIDSIVGGGGLVLVPALFATFPSTPPATLLGTNKVAAIWGTLISSHQFAKRVNLNWRVLIPAAAFALLGSLCGAWVVTMVDPTFLRRLLPLVMVVVLFYTLWNKNLGTVHTLRGHTSGRCDLHNWRNNWFLRRLFRPRCRKLLRFFIGAVDGLRLSECLCVCESSECGYQLCGSCLICIKRACLVANWFDVGRRQYRGKFGGHPPCAETRRVICPPYFYMGSEPVNSQNRLRCIF